MVTASREQGNPTEPYAARFTQRIAIADIFFINKETYKWKIKI